MKKLEREIKKVGVLAIVVEVDRIVLDLCSILINYILPFTPKSTLASSVLFVMGIIYYVKKKPKAKVNVIKLVTKQQSKESTEEHIGNGVLFLGDKRA